MHQIKYDLLDNFIRQNITISVATLAHNNNNVSNNSPKFTKN